MKNVKFCNKRCFYDPRIFWSRIVPTFGPYLENMWLQLFSRCKITIEKIKSIETFIRELFSDKYQVDDSCNKDEKFSKIGPLFWNNPDKFTFTLVDIDSILAAVDVCIKISDGEKLPIMKLPQAPIFENQKSVPVEILL